MKISANSTRLVLPFAAALLLAACGGGSTSAGLSNSLAAGASIGTPTTSTTTTTGATGGTGTAVRPPETALFSEMAAKASCADVKNALYLIDNKLVFWSRAGKCADASYGYTLFGTTPDVIWCENYDSIAGPRTSCKDESVREIFDTAVKNADKADLGLGSAHQILPLPVPVATLPTLTLMLPRTIAQTSQSAIKAARNVVIRNQEDFTALLAENAGPGTHGFLSAVNNDFSKVTMVAVFAGELPLGCYDLGIDAVIKNGAGYDVQYHLDDLSATCRLAADAAKPAPMHLVVVDSALSGPVNFVRQDKGLQGQRDVAEAQQLFFPNAEQDVIKDSASWTALWNTHQKAGVTAGAAPAIDFAREMVIGVAAGQQSGPCFETRIDKVSKGAAGVTVYYSTRNMQAVCLVLPGAGPAYPKHFVAVERQDAPVQFVKVDADNSTVAFETIKSGGYGLAAEQARVVKDADTWATLWAAANGNLVPVPAAPAIDFTKKMVIAVSSGTQPSLCYGIGIDRIRTGPDGLTVEYTKRQPAEGAMCAQALAAPTQFVVLDRSDLPVQFANTAYRL
jgi:hypothetical protein